MKGLERGISREVKIYREILEALGGLLVNSGKVRDSGKNGGSRGEEVVNRDPERRTYVHGGCAEQIYDESLNIGFF